MKWTDANPNTMPGPGDLWAGPDTICDDCGYCDGEHGDDCPAVEYEPDYDPRYDDSWADWPERN